MEHVANGIEGDRTLVVVDGDQRHAVADDLVLETQRLDKRYDGGVVAVCSPA